MLAGPIWGDGRMYKSGLSWYNLISDHFARNSLTSETDVPISVPSPYVKLYNSSNIGGFTYDSSNDVFYFPGYLDTDLQEQHVLQYDPNTATVTEVVEIDATPDIYTIYQFAYDDSTSKLFVVMGSRLYFYQM